VGIVAVWGPPKCGKSFWAFDLAMHNALGWEYRGRRVIAGTIVYCAFEGAEGFKARAAAFRQHHDVAADGEVSLFLMPTRLVPPFWWCSIPSTVVFAAPNQAMKT